MTYEYEVVVAAVGIGILGFVRACSTVASILAGGINDCRCTVRRERIPRAATRTAHACRTRAHQEIGREIGDADKAHAIGSGIHIVHAEGRAAPGTHGVAESISPCVVEKPLCIHTVQSQRRGGHIAVIEIGTLAIRGSAAAGKAFRAAAQRRTRQATITQGIADQSLLDLVQLFARVVDVALFDLAGNRRYQSAQQQRDDEQGDGDLDQGESA